MESFRWLEPWESVGVGEELVAELQRELSPKHTLYGCRVDAIARRRDNDNVLFHVLEEPPRLAVVHLTWAEEPDPRWPWTLLYDDMTDWTNRCMIPDHKQWIG
jgi:hypothetical protein